MLQKSLFSILSLLFIVVSYGASAQGFAPTLREGTFKPRPIAVSPFHSDSVEHQKFAEDIPSIIRWF